MVNFEGAYCILKLQTGIPKFIDIREKSTLRDLLSDIFPNSKTPLLSQTGNKEFDVMFSLHAADEDSSNKFRESKFVALLLNFKKQQNWQVQYFLAPEELHIAIGSFNKEGINVNNPIDECVFTETFINYINDLIRLAEELSKIKQQGVPISQNI